MQNKEFDLRVSYIPHLMDPYEELATEIVVMACKDYKKALAEIDKYKNSYSRGYIRNRRIISDCERFFQGEWIQALTTLDGISIMNRLREEAEND